MFEHTSYLGFALILILTGCGLPVPEEVPIVAAGVLSSQNQLEPWLAFAACVAGALLGDLVIYSAGYYWGHNLIKRHPRFAQLIHAQNEAQLETLIQQHGMKVLFVTRFMVGIRAPVYLAAGTLRTPLRWFLAADAVCATSVVGAFFWLSYLFGDRIAAWIRKGEILLTVVVVLAIVAFMLIAWWKGKQWLAKLVGGQLPSEQKEAADGHAVPIQPAAAANAKGEQTDDEPRPEQHPSPPTNGSAHADGQRTGTGAKARG